MRLSNCSNGYLYLVLSGPLLCAQQRAASQQISRHYRPGHCLRLGRRSDGFEIVAVLLDHELANDIDPSAFGNVTPQLHENTTDAELLLGGRSVE